jgi:hypothetical protein
MFYGMKKTLLILAVFVMSLGSSVFAVSWPPPSDYTVLEWYPGMGTIEHEQIVFYKDGFYQCTNPSGVGSDNEEEWNPKILSTDYIMVAPGRIWETGLGAIAMGELFVFEDGVFQSIIATSSWGDPGWSPKGWNSTSYTKICNAILAPEEDDGLPANYVGYFYNNVIRFRIGWVGINVETNLVYRCIAQPSLDGGGEGPGQTGGYWWNSLYAAGDDNHWQSPSESLGQVEDLLSIMLPAIPLQSIPAELATVPYWNDGCAWPMGAIVQHEGKYYNFVWNANNKFTTKGAGQEPGTTAGEDFWMEIELNEPTTNVAQTAANQWSYFVQNGYLAVNSSEQVSIQLYNITGVLIATANGASIQLPQNGVYIAKINVGGEIATVKVLK